MTLRLPPRPAFWDQAICTGKTDLFFPKNGRSTAAAKNLCAACPVLHECHEDAMAEGEWLQGVRAGLTEQDRRRLLRGAA